MEMPAGPSPLDDIAADPSLNSTTPTAQTTPVMPTTPTMPATDPMTVGMPTAPVQESEPIVVPTEAEATEASPNIAGGGAIDLSELAKMTDAAFDTMATANTDVPTDENVDGANPSAETQHTLTEEEIAANEAQARAASEASLAEASTSMQNMHQNIMADVKPKEREEVAQASIASKSRRRVKISKKAIIITIIVIILLAGGGALAYFIVSGAFHTLCAKFKKPAD